MQPSLPDSGVVCYRQHRQLTQQCSTSRQTRWDSPQNSWDECAWRVPWPLWQVDTHIPVHSPHCVTFARFKCLLHHVRRALGLCNAGLLPVCARTPTSQLVSVLVPNSVYMQGSSGSRECIAGVAVYNFALKDVPLRKMFLYTSLLGALLGMTQILLITGVQILRKFSRGLQTMVSQTPQLSAPAIPRIVVCD